MRPKFRAWCKKDKVMYHGIEKGISFDDGSEYTFKDFLNNKGYHEYKITQFIEIHDRNGKEIFEGDFVKITGKEDHEYMNNNKFEIKSICDWCYLISNYHVFILEVIGNKWEHPRLLKE